MHKYSFANVVHQQQGILLTPTILTHSILVVDDSMINRNIYSNQLSGTIPSSIVSLYYLEYLYVQSNT